MTPGYLMFWLAVAVAVGFAIFLVIRLKHALEDLGSGITGIWTNSDESMRVLIYNMDSILQGNVVWTRQPDSTVLGSTVIQNVKLRFFILGQGTYHDPVTRKKYQFRLRIMAKNIMHFWLHDEKGQPVINEEWRLVEG